LRPDAPQPRSYLTFVGASFNVSEEKPAYFKPDNFGDDVAAFLARGLRRVGWEIPDDIGQEDDGWFVTFQKPGHCYDLIVQLVNAETHLWLVWVERSVGFIPSLLGFRKKPVPIEAAVAIFDAIRGAPEIENPQWFTKDEFLGGQAGRPTPVS